MKLIYLLLLFIPVLAQSQTKEDIIHQILKINRLQDDMRGLFLFGDSSQMTPTERAEHYKIPSAYDNYANFQALLQIISHQELVDLTKNENAVLRMFALRALVNKRDRNYDYYNFFLKEFERKDSIDVKYGCIGFRATTYEIFLYDLSGDWNYAHSTGGNENAAFLDQMLKPIDSFTLVEKFDFPDAVYTSIFDRQQFDSSFTKRIIELIDNSFNIWAFNYLMITNPKVFQSIEKKTVRNVLKNNTVLFDQHPGFFQGFLRYLVSDKQFDNAKQMIQVFSKDEYFKEKMEQMLGNIDKDLVDKVR